MIYLDITQDDIDGAGEPFVARECPVARALIRTGILTTLSCVTCMNIYHSTRGDARAAHAADVSHDACEFIRDFDAGRPVTPCRLALCESLAPRPENL